MSSALAGLIGVGIGGVLGLLGGYLSNVWATEQRREERAYERAQAHVLLCREVSVRYLTSCQMLADWLAASGLDDSRVAELLPMSRGQRLVALTKEFRQEVAAYNDSRNHVILVVSSDVRSAFDEYDGSFRTEFQRFLLADSPDAFRLPFRDFEGTEVVIVDALKREETELLTPKPKPRTQIKIPGQGDWDRPI
ncbi:MAG: hypothetical protein ACLPY3_01885 [Solirubrobacteraceae bacterium]